MTQPANQRLQVEHATAAPLLQWDDWERIVLGAFGLGSVFLCWELSARLGWVNPVVISSPTAIGQAFVNQLSSGALLQDLAVTTVELLVGFGLALFFGLALGFFMGLVRVFEYAADPFVWFIYSAPIIALYPILIVWFGYGFTTVVAITFLLTFVSITVNAIAGVHSVEKQLIQAVRAFGGSRLDVVVKLMIPAAFSYILGGIRIGLGRALTGVTLGEMFGSSAGLGYRLTFYASNLKTADMFVPLIVLVAMGLILFWISDLVETLIFAWRRA